MKVKIETNLYRIDYEWRKEPVYALHDSEDMGKSSPDWALIRKCEFEVDVPDDFDPVPQKIANLREAKQEILAEAHVKAQNIEDQIQRLLCIEHKPDLVTP